MHNLLIFGIESKVLGSKIHFCLGDRKSGIKRPGIKCPFLVGDQKSRDQKSGDQMSIFGLGIKSPGIKCPGIKCPFWCWGSKVRGSNVHFRVRDQTSSGSNVHFMSGIKCPRDRTSSGSIDNPFYGIENPKSKVWGSKVRGSNVHHPISLTTYLMNFQGYFLFF